MTRPIPNAGAVPAVPSVFDAVLDGAAECVERLGVERMTVEDVVKASAVSRATIYRHFGNKDAILSALFERTARPFEEDAKALLTGEAAFADRIEATLVWAAIEHSSSSTPRAVLAHGVSTATLNLFNALYRPVFQRVLNPVFTEAQLAGEMPDDLDVSEVIEWFVRQMLVLLSEPFEDELSLRRRIRQFILPVLSRGSPGSASELSKPMRALSSRLDELDGILQSLKGDIRRMSHGLDD